MRVARSRIAALRNVAGVAALLVILLAGCGLPLPFPQPTPDPKLPDAQQILRPLVSGANAGDVDTLDPGQIQFGFNYGMAQLIFPQLVTLDDKQQPVDWAAESHTISADGLTYTFHLRRGMAWSDGTPIDATTFAYSINRALDPCLGSGVSYYLFDLAGEETFNKGTCPSGAIKGTATLIGSSIQTPDPLTLRLTLTHPAGYFLAALTFPTSWAVPQALVEKYTTPAYGGTKSTWTEHLTDNGSFGGNLYLLATWQHSRTSLTSHGSLTFDRNERFWGKKPLLHRIEYTLYQDVAVEWNDFTQGKGDISNFPSAQLAEARALKGASVFDTPALSFAYLAPNWTVAPFDDVRVRQAYSLALDRNTLGSEALRAFRHPTIHFVPEGIPGYNPGLTDAAGRKGKDAFTPDLAMARKLASAYAAEKCTGDFAKCPPVTYTVPSGSSTQMDLAQAIVTQWRQAFPGWMIQFAGLRASGQLKTFLEFQLAWNGWGADYPDPQDFLSLLWTTKAAYNQSHVRVPQADTLLAQADGMSDQTARIPLYQLAEQFLVNQAAAIPLSQQMYFYSLRSHVVGWRIAPTLWTPLSV